MQSANMQSEHKLCSAFRIVCGAQPRTVSRQQFRDAVRQSSTRNVALDNAVQALRYDGFEVRAPVARKELHVASRIPSHPAR